MLVVTILRRYVPEFEVRAFGSRVTGEHLRAHSDLDLLVMTDTPLQPELKAGIAAAFTDSNLPFRVDVLEWAVVDKPFRNRIMADSVVMKPANE